MLIRLRDKTVVMWILRQSPPLLCSLGLGMTRNRAIRIISMLQSKQIYHTIPVEMALISKYQIYAKIFNSVAHITFCGLSLYAIFSAEIAC